MFFHHVHFFTMFPMFFTMLLYFHPFFPMFFSSILHPMAPQHGPWQRRRAMASAVPRRRAAWRRPTPLPCNAFIPAAPWNALRPPCAAAARRWERWESYGNVILVGGFKHFLFSIMYGIIMIILPIDWYFSRWLKPPTSISILGIS